MKIDTRNLKNVSFADLCKVIALANAELDRRNREAEHYAHLSRTSDDPKCRVCRDAAAIRRDT